MSVSALLSLMMVYPVMLLGDGCVVIAIALVATTGGNPWICGAAFALFHALYSIIGMLLATEVADYSETLGSLIVAVGSAILLKHFVHHRLHHISHGDCSCEAHSLEPASTIQMISTAAALSIHALAAGPIVSQVTGVREVTTLVPVLLATSLFVGVIIALVVFVGEKRRGVILKTLDTLPGVVTATLSGLTSYAIFHLLRHLVDMSLPLSLGLISLFTLLSCYFGFWMHCRSVTPAPIQITTKLSKPKAQI
jgi:hypothetical protein